MNEKIANDKLDSNFHDVGRFHEKFGLDNCTFGNYGPYNYHKLAGNAKTLEEASRVPPNKELMEFRLNFMKEELEEFEKGFEAQDLEKMFDSLLDLAYVVFGTAHLLGFPWQHGWSVVQQANMAKKRAESADESRRGSTFDVVKPEGWAAPDIKGVLRTHGFKL